MKQKKNDYFAGLRRVVSPRENLAWGLLAVLAWAFQVVRFHDPSVAFPVLFFLKGAALVLAAAVVYHFSVFEKGFSFLGMFPLLWLALSRFQWKLCAGGEFHFGLWLVLFLLAETIILVYSDGKKLLVLLSPLWVWLIWLSPVSFLLPFGFLFPFRGNFPNASWVKWGGAMVGSGLFLFLKGWQSIGFDGLGVFDFLVTTRFAALLLLGCLGLAAFPAKGTWRYAATPLLALAAGFVLWPAADLDPNRLEMFEWILVFFAGFGWESFRRDLMDDTWHGRALWFAMGLSIFWGVV